MSNKLLALDSLRKAKERENNEVLKAYALAEQQPEPKPIEYATEVELFRSTFNRAWGWTEAQVAIRRRHWKAIDEHYISEVNKECSCKGCNKHLRFGGDGYTHRKYPELVFCEICLRNDMPPAGY